MNKIAPTAYQFWLAESNNRDMYDISIEIKRDILNKNGQAFDLMLQADCLDFSMASYKKAAQFILEITKEPE
jgi:hypothetical protein